MAMKHPYPVYRDGDHYYTICRDGPGYGIAMIPAAGGPSHIIVTPGTWYLADALAYLRDMTRQSRMTRIKKCPASVAALDRGRNPNHQQYNTPEPKPQLVMRPGRRRIG